MRRGDVAKGGDSSIGRDDFKRIAEREGVDDGLVLVLDVDPQVEIEFSVDYPMRGHIAGCFQSFPFHRIHVGQFDALRVEGPIKPSSN